MLKKIKTTLWLYLDDLLLIAGRGLPVPRGRAGPSGAGLGRGRRVPGLVRPVGRPCGRGEVA